MRYTQRRCLGLIHSEILWKISKILQCKSLQKGGISHMTRDDLSPEKKKQYAEIVEAMMKDIKRRQENQQPLKESQLSCAYGNKPYFEVQKIYLPQLQALFEKS